jgi:hypothetical protein
VVTTDPVTLRQYSTPKAPTPAIETSSASVDAGTGWIRLTWPASSTDGMAMTYQVTVGSITANVGATEFVASGLEAGQYPLTVTACHAATDVPAPDGCATAGGGPVKLLTRPGAPVVVVGPAGQPGRFSLTVTGGATGGWPDTSPRYSLDRGDTWQALTGSTTLAGPVLVQLYTQLGALAGPSVEAVAPPVAQGGGG